LFIQIIVGGVWFIAIATKEKEKRRNGKTPGKMLEKDFFESVPVEERWIG
jgi:hypothetical protein